MYSGDHEIQHMLFWAGLLSYRIKLCKEQEFWRQTVVNSDSNIGKSGQ